MSLERLIVVHTRKMAREGGVIFTPDVLSPSAFAVETCLRRLWVSVSTPSTTRYRASTAIGVERFTGVDAYEFLLRTACGLESAIAGESDVFGQLKEAWQSFRRERRDAAAALEPLMQRLFEDVKHIRSRHLCGLGATTYGSLVRTLLGTDADAPTLLVGAGQMARAVLPYLPGRPLLVANRTESHARQLIDDLRPNLASASLIEVVDSAPELEMSAWERASNVIVCVPPEPERDALRVRAWRSRPASGRRLLHLGILSPDGTPWHSIPALQTLSDLFGLQMANQNHRQHQLGRANRECRERARLRDLGGPISLAHGWEDLSLFANIA
jgi:hypothetical protein